ncbi:hypothetical protein ACFFU9_14985 [Mariniflexile ostreae]|uniref:peptidylprolyl isomerase n=1 Tax=Mariniflexile ostreae TaxID=1520892 RepID=A0ABV5FF25_9FLAO
MKLRKILAPVLCVLIGFTSCKKDDDDDVVVTPPRDRGEQQIADNDSIVKYLKTHYYNAADFEDKTATSITHFQIGTVVDGVIPDPDKNALLFGSAALDSISVEYANTNYNIYYLKLSEGKGDALTFADNVRLNYEGLTLDHVTFDSSANPTVFDLTGTVPGWSKIIPLFKTAETYTENTDGTVSYANHGVGVMFLPSGLAYFSQTQVNIPAYSPLIFKFDLFEMQQNDHDNDGVPSYLEDLNGNGEFYTVDGFADDDTDGDGIPNFMDPDDDGDGVPTKREDFDNDGYGDGDPTNDIGKNGIPKYLDPEETEANKL